MVGGDPLPFGERLRALREAASLTQAELAERAGISVKAVSALERGRRQRPYPHTVRALADALGLSERERSELVGAMPSRRLTATPVRAGGPSLPAPPAHIIGRERELTEIAGLLRTGMARMITLTGAGGVGKTRLALDVAAQLSETFAGRVAFVPLAPLSDPELVLPSVAQSLGLTEAGDTTAQAMLTEHLGEHPWLLILDNLEHLLNTAPELADLLAACPRLSLVATSRAPLKIRAEHEYPVRPLALPDLNGAAELVEIAHVSSVQLFLERARAAAPHFELTESNCAAVAAICRRLDGLPLALELVAARVRVLSPSELQDRLEHVLPLLVGGSRDLPQRQQTMQAAINWSYELLSPVEQSMFRRLSVFCGGWTLEAAEAVTAWGLISTEHVIDLLSGLVEQSLVIAEVSTDGLTRYRMLEPIRQFAAVRVDESEERAELSDRHLAWCLALAQRAMPELRGPTQQQWLNRLESEHDNLRAALTWAEQDASRSAQGLQLATALWRFWATRGHLTEGRRWLDHALAAGAAQPANLRAEGLNGAGNLARDQGDHSRSAELLELSLALFREIEDKRGVALVLNNLGTVMLDVGDYERATSLYEGALEGFRDLAADWESAMVLHNMGIALGFRGEVDRATTLLEEALGIWSRLDESVMKARSLDALGEVERKRANLERAGNLHNESLMLRREIGDTRGIAVSLKNLGMVAHYRGDYEIASRHIEESLRLRRMIGDRFGVAVSLSSLAEIARQQGDVHRAADLYREATATMRQLGIKAGLAECLFGLAAVAEANGDHERAARLLGASDALRDQLDHPVPTVDRADYDRTVSTIRKGLTPERFTDAIAAGSALTLDQAIAEALDNR